MSRIEPIFSANGRVVTVNECSFPVTHQNGVKYARIMWACSDKSHPTCNGDATKCPDLWRIPEPSTPLVESEKKGSE